ncbi:MFS transporter [Streptomyces armeniacus]|uniref:MFS transporter n=1 Tax=Streptomyces armeniacus TaxID=83291 RepID=A0A345XQ22_9ACTN|nr:MFS transporter [Streptomyces armeniacus]AXK33738.1 MFS transporter [Streptomyces armeniacus]
MTTPAPDPRRWWALGALGACMLVLGFDLTILNVALPEMAAQLDADTGEMQWIVDAYVVVFAATMLPAGLLGDRFGRRRMLIAGLVVFLAGSLAGTLADTPAWVIAARTGMGLGAALMTPLALSVVPSLFEGAERTKAIGVITAAVAAGMPLGPVIGGWLLDNYWWGSIFLINLPLAGLGIVACALLLPETRDPNSPRVDPVSAVLSVAGLGALVFGIIEAPERGWADPLVLGCFAASAALIALLARRERQAAHPMLDLELLAHRGFLWNTVAATLVTLVMGGLLFVLPQYLQAVLGYDALGTGVRLMPMMAGLLVAARGAGPLAARFGPRPVVSGGLLTLAFAALLGARTELGDGYAFTAGWLTVTGLGVGFAMVPAMDSALSTLPPDRSGSGSGLLMTMRQMGAAIGVALLGSLLSGAYESRLDTDGLPSAAAAAARDSVVGAQAVGERLGAEAVAESARSAFLQGMGLVLVVCALASLAAAVLVALLLPNRRPGSKSVTDGMDMAPVDRDGGQ